MLSILLLIKLSTESTYVWLIIVLELKINRTIRYMKLNHCSRSYARFLVALKCTIVITKDPESAA